MNIWINISILVYCNNTAWASNIYRFWQCPEIKLKSVTSYYKWEKWRTYWNSGLIPLYSEILNLHLEWLELRKLYVAVKKIRDMCEAMKYFYQDTFQEPGQIAQWICTLTGLSEDMGSVSRTHISVHNCL